VNQASDLRVGNSSRRSQWFDPQPSPTHCVEPADTGNSHGGAKMNLEEINPLTVESGILSAMELFLPIIAANPPDSLYNIKKAIEVIEIKTRTLELHQMDTGTLAAMRALRRALEVELSRALSAHPGSNTDMLKVGMGSVSAAPPAP
jgi:hypothetical protein